MTMVLKRLLLLHLCVPVCVFIIDLKGAAADTKHNRSAFPESET